MANDKAHKARADRGLKPRTVTTDHSAKALKVTKKEAKRGEG